jgi:hypothetical protein
MMKGALHYKKGPRYVSMLQPDHGQKRRHCISAGVNSAIKHMLLYGCPNASVGVVMGGITM